jgi:hypothetical protein
MRDTYAVSTPRSLADFYIVLVPMQPVNIGQV